MEVFMLRKIIVASTLGLFLATSVVTPAAAATPSPSASAKPVTPKKISITCVKGKTTKKVTAINPKCPAGYKKK